MRSILCSDVYEWLTTHDNQPRSAIPPVELCDHIASCAACRALVLLLSTELLHAPLHITPISCEQCQHDLAVYADMVHDEGQQAGLREYPHVWWHLWVCADCAEIYHTLVTLQDAENAPEDILAVPVHKHILRTSQAVPAPRPFITAFSLPRVWLSRVLMSQLATPWGSSFDDTILHDEDHDEYRINVVMRRDHDSWSIIVTVEPPLVGDIVLSIGNETFRQALRPDGTAIIDSLPSELLLDPTGPGIALVLEPAE